MDRHSHSGRHADFSMGLKQLKQISVGTAVWLKYSTGTVPPKPNGPGTLPIGHGNEKTGTDHATL
jgi:hypothetical protein